MADEWIEKIEDLINEFPDDRFIELLDEMVYRAETARNARLEETTDVAEDDGA